MTEYQKAVDGTTIPKLDTENTYTKYVNSVSKSYPKTHNRPKGVTIFAILTILSSLIYLLPLIIKIISGHGLEILYYIFTSLYLLPIGRGILEVLLLAIGAYDIVVGIGLLYGNNWAKILVMIGAALQLLSIPFGTAYGLILLYYFTRPGVKEFFKIA